MIYTLLTIKAMKIAYTAHAGQVDKAGAPYIFHPYRVAESMPDEISTCAALLHDVVEDTDVTLDELRAEFPEEVIRAIRLLTRSKGEEYFRYIERIKSSENAVARRVKLADLRDNCDLSRLAFCSLEVQAQAESLIKRYAKAISILSGES